ncbi:histidine phosphatase family protein [Massilia sp. CF038]|uniref:histidine phosphatase family protein n=1 Tax=Massilia sp. CF038 TaxID=1881045 RepID=UPI00090F4CB2|nr:histidine phosphatase family protein [Massilia sp. CF038]SHH73315.1 alpha-ribazole phosphatase [Massilia sp. CF038]
MRLHLVRHLAPQVAKGVCYGRTDLAVDPTLEAASLTALRQMLPSAVPVYTSPLRRCASLATALQPLARVDPRLAELDFGAWEMQRWDDIARADIEAWAADLVHYRPGGGESVFAMAERIDAFYNDLLGQQLPEAIVICHAGSMRLLAARQRGLDPLCMARAAAEQPHAIGYGQVIVIDCV